VTLWDQIFANFCINFLAQDEAICKTASAHESGPKGGLFDEKNPRVENLVTLSI
jgi:hypothetical protein